MQCHKGCRLEHPLRAMSLVSWGVERLTRFSLSLYLFRVIWLNVYKVLLCLHCWGITTIRCPSMLAYVRWPTSTKHNTHSQNTTHTAKTQHTLPKHNTHSQNTTHTAKTQHTLPKHNTHSQNTTHTTKTQHTHCQNTTHTVKTQHASSDFTETQQTLSKQKKTRKHNSAY